MKRKRGLNKKGNTKKNYIEGSLEPINKTINSAQIEPLDAKSTKKKKPKKIKGKENRKGRSIKKLDVGKVKNEEKQKTVKRDEMKKTKKHITLDQQGKNPLFNYEGINSSSLASSHIFNKEAQEWKFPIEKLRTTNDLVEKSEESYQPKILTTPIFAQASFMNATQTKSDHEKTILLAPFFGLNLLDTVNTFIKKEKVPTNKERFQEHKDLDHNIETQNQEFKIPEQSNSPKSEKNDHESIYTPLESKKPIAKDVSKSECFISQPQIMKSEELDNQENLTEGQKNVHFPLEHRKGILKEEQDTKEVLEKILSKVEEERLVDENYKEKETIKFDKTNSNKENDTLNNQKRLTFETDAPKKAKKSEVGDIPFLQEKNEGKEDTVEEEESFLDQKKEESFLLEKKEEEKKIKAFSQAKNESILKDKINERETCIQNKENIETEKSLDDEPLFDSTLTKKRIDEKNPIATIKEDDESINDEFINEIVSSYSISETIEQNIIENEVVKIESTLQSFPPVHKKNQYLEYEKLICDEETKKRQNEEIKKAMNLIHSMISNRFLEHEKRKYQENLKLLKWEKEKMESSNEIKFEEEKKKIELEHHQELQKLKIHRELKQQRMIEAKKRKYEEFQKTKHEEEEKEEMKRSMHNFRNFLVKKEIISRRNLEHEKRMEMELHKIWKNNLEIIKEEKNENQQEEKDEMIWRKEESKRNMMFERFKSRNPKIPESPLKERFMEAMRTKGIEIDANMMKWKFPKKSKLSQRIIDLETDIIANQTLIDVIGDLEKLELQERNEIKRTVELSKKKNELIKNIIAQRSMEIAKRKNSEDRKRKKQIESDYVEKIQMTKEKEETIRENEEKSSLSPYLHNNQENKWFGKLFGELNHNIKKRNDKHKIKEIYVCRFNLPNDK